MPFQYFPQFIATRLKHVQLKQSKHILSLHLPPFVLFILNFRFHTPGSQYYKYCPILQISTNRNRCGAYWRVISHSRLANLVLEGRRESHLHSESPFVKQESQPRCPKIPCHFQMVDWNSLSPGANNFSCLYLFGTHCLYIVSYTDALGKAPQKYSYWRYSGKTVMSRRISLWQARDYAPRRSWESIHSLIPLC